MKLDHYPLETLLDSLNRALHNHLRDLRMRVLLSKRRKKDLIPL
jgi:hypothetical protein